MRIGLSHNFPLDKYPEIAEKFEIVRPKEYLSSFSREEILSLIPSCDAFIFIADTKCDKEIIDKGVKLKAIGNLGSGFDNIDVKTATERKIPVLNTPNAVVAPTAEMTMALILSIARSVVRYDRTLRKTLYCKGDLLLERDMCLAGKKLGIIGFGRIGKRLGHLASAFDMQVLYYDPYRDEEMEKKIGAIYYTDPDSLIRDADVISLHLPYSKENHHFMDSRRISLMKKTAYLVNASRGPIVDEEALIKALEENAIRGAALDVHEHEPNLNKRMTEFENVVLTPHICTNMAEIRLNMLGELLEGVNSLLIENTVPRNVVNRSIYA